MWKIKIYIVSRGKSAGRQTKREGEKEEEQLKNWQAVRPAVLILPVILSVCLSVWSGSGVAGEVSDRFRRLADGIRDSRRCLLRCPSPI